MICLLHLVVVPGLVDALGADELSLGALLAVAFALR